MPSNSNSEGTGHHRDETSEYRRGNEVAPIGALSPPEVFAEFRPRPPAENAAAGPSGGPRTDADDSSYRSAPWGCTSPDGHGAGVDVPAPSYPPPGEPSEQTAAPPPPRAYDKSASPESGVDANGPAAQLPAAPAQHDGTSAPSEPPADPPAPARPGGDPPPGSAEAPPDARSEQPPAFILYKAGEEFASALGDLTMWVDGLLLPVYGREVASSAPWCPRWWEHMEAVAQFYGLWMAWQGLTGPGTPLVGPANWHRDYLGPVMASLRDPSGPFAGCKTGSHRPKEWPQTEKP